MGRLQRKKTTRYKKKKTSDVKIDTAKDSSDGKAGPSSMALSRKDGYKNPVVQKRINVKSKAAPSLEKNFFQKGAQFLREVKVELKKVVWPTRKQTMGSTAVVIILVMIIALFLGVVDFCLSYLVRMILQ